MTGKRIGFVDYKLENFHANVFLKAIRETLQARGFSVGGCFALDEVGGQIWAAKNGVDYFSSPQALNDRVDCYMVLAPSNPELHLELCRKVLPFGKITYVDKTFAPDLDTARRIFALADEYKVPLQTSSALRYTNVQKQLAEPVQHMVAWGGGSSFAEYAIHPVEMVISCMGAEARAVMRRGGGDYSQLLIDLSGRRTAVVNVYTPGNTPFAAAITASSGTRHITVDASMLFIDTASAILNFFEAGKEQIARAESLMIRRILDAAEDPNAMKDFVSLWPKPL